MWVAEKLDWKGLTDCATAYLLHDDTLVSIILQLKFYTITPFKMTQLGIMEKQLCIAKTADTNFLVY
jgi:hypothetical protein